MTNTIEIHALQRLPLNNVNRDDMGRPKTATFGGTTRARISSQAWKHAMRKAFRDGLIDPSQLGHRTRRAVALLTEQIQQNTDWSTKDCQTRITAALKLAGLLSAKKKAEANPDTIDGRPPLTEYLLFLSNAQIDALVDLITTTKNGTTLTKRDVVTGILNSGNGMDLAIFGRMVADVASLNVDSAIQVAHAISVHPVDIETDYFTGVDDFPDDENSAGAAMIGNVDFSSSVVYRYATLNLDALADNLGSTELVPAAARAVTEAFITSMPSGKVNTFANHTLPEAVAVFARTDQPLSLANAFYEPTPATGATLQKATHALVEHHTEFGESYDQKITETWTLAVGAAKEPMRALAKPGTLTALLDNVETYAK